ncbi:MAG: GNAT family N-acetyltransferase [Thermoanaerobaculia bacterium]
MSDSLRLRPARPDDYDFLIELTYRLADFEIPPWRSREEIAAIEHAPIRLALAEPDPDLGLIVAEQVPGGERLGYAMLLTQRDFFTGEKHAHLSILAVRREAEGRGVARALLEATDDWARERGLPFITLTVFHANVRARALYERLGWQPDTRRYRKEL